MAESIFAAARLRELEEIFTAHYGECLSRSRAQWKGTRGALDAVNPSSNNYTGIWPDDFQFLFLAGGEKALTQEQCRKIMDFLTDTVLGLTRFPDSVSGDGVPRFGYDAFTGAHMSTSLPGSWVRLLAAFEARGIEIPEKAAWADLYIRSLAQLEFSCGLVFVPQELPRISYPFHDIVSITGMELMSSVSNYRGLQLADTLFSDCISEETRRHWRRLREGIRGNLYRLYDESEGIFLAGSIDNRIADVWGSGFAYPLASPEQKEAIGKWYVRNREAVFREGMTRQMARPEGWNRLMVPKQEEVYTTNRYMNGGFWAIGTGFVLNALYDQAPELAIELLEELAVSLPKYEYREWVYPPEPSTGAAHFMAGISLVLVALRSILEGKQLLEVL